MPNRGVNVGYDLLQDLVGTGQLVPVDGEFKFADGVTKLVLKGKGNNCTRQYFADGLAEANEDDLAKQCNRYIWLAAFASNNANSDYHWMCDACYYECYRRDRVDIYQAEYDKLVAENTR